MMASLLMSCCGSRRRTTPKTFSAGIDAKSSSFVTSSRSSASAQARTHNAQNEVTGVGGAALGYDANGNLTRDEAGRQLVYDAWDRLEAVSGRLDPAAGLYDFRHRQYSINLLRLDNGL
jgi:hypothetical protein